MAEKHRISEKCCRIQVYQPDGGFVTKFGGIGNREGLFQNPHFIAVTRSGSLVVSDSANHRIQVIDFLTIMA